MNVRINSSPERQEEIRKVLPKISLIDSIILPALKELMQETLLKALRAEIEIYKNYPKNNGSMNVETFNPRNHKTCFMGQGFMVGNGDMQDADLRDYRKAVGTLHHSIWGNATLLEIWAGDHFSEHTKMVSDVFKYCRDDRKTLPALKFFIIPLFRNEESGTMVGDENDKAAAMAEYLIVINGMRAEYNLPPTNKVEGEYLKDFELQWEEKLRGDHD